MRIKVSLKQGVAKHGLDLDLTHVQMTDEQRKITRKLFRQIRNELIDLEAKDPCEEGKCLASKHLTKDEFFKVRGLKAQLATFSNPGGFFMDFCVHAVVVPK